jgi:hypothetical protein
MPGNAETQKFLNHIREMDDLANRVELSAAQLDSFIRNPTLFTQESHENEWRYITDDLKGMAEHANTIAELDGLEGWQEELAREIVSYTAAMAEQAEMAVKFVMGTESMVKYNNSDYKARVAPVHTYADRIDNLVIYGKTRWELENDGSQ